MELSGILKRLRSKAWPLPPNEPVNDYVAVTFEHILFIYIILMIGMILSVLIFLFEYYLTKLRIEKGFPSYKARKRQFMIPKGVNFKL